MSTRVYQFGLRAPIEGEASVRQQMRAAHEYRNDLVAIERGRRAAIRTIHNESEAVTLAVEKVKTTPKKERPEAWRALAKARREAERERSEDVDRIKELDQSIRRDARALTSTWWGTYLLIEASADQARKSPLYERDQVTPLDIRFVRGPRLGREAFPPDDPRATWWLGDAQVGIHVQGRTLLTPEVFAAKDAYVRLVPQREPERGYYVLWLRVGSEGREPVWAKWPLKLHRKIPDAAAWKWVRVSYRREGMREQWSCEVTLDLPEEIASPRMLDKTLSGAIAVEACWEPVEGGADEIRVARWRDSRGEAGEIVLPKRIVWAVRHTDTFRSIRDKLRNERVPRLQQALIDSKDVLPPWLAQARDTMRLWVSPERFRALALRWRLDGCDAARTAYEILDTWEARENHLYEYECSERSQALRARREFYRTLAAKWSRTYRDLLVDDRDLTREARWGEESDVRFTAAPSEMRQCLRSAFGGAIECPWQGGPREEGRAWLERAIERWSIEQNSGGAREEEIASNVAGAKGGAWAKRKAKKRARAEENETARKVSGEAGE